MEKNIHLNASQMDFDFLFCMGPKTEEQADPMPVTSPPAVDLNTTPSRGGGGHGSDVDEEVAAKLRAAEEALATKDTDLEVAEARREVLEVSRKGDLRVRFRCSCLLSNGNREQSPLVR